jgi:hypothetical protein
VSVKLVQKEFELRAQGFSFREIYQKNIDADLVPEDQKKTYSRRGIEERLKNPLYWGYFFLAGAPTRYEGSHELIIPDRILKAVDAINKGKTWKRRTITSGEDVFRGWLVCGNPECQRLITYEKKLKTLKSTGESKVYHFYRCHNSRRIHDAKKYISEDKIWSQFEPVLENLTISEEFARDITNTLNETNEQQKLAMKKQMEGYRLALKDLEKQEDSAYEDMKNGLLEDKQYRRQIQKIRDERDDYNRQLEQLNLSISDAGMVAVKKVFELAINAKTLWNSMDRQERVEYLKKVCSNPTLNDLTLHYQLQKPFARLASWAQNKEWRRRGDSNPQVLSDARFRVWYLTN